MSTPASLSIRLRLRSRLTLAQEVGILGAIVLAYAFLPPTRSAALQVLCLTLVLGMFTLKPREVIVACGFAVGLLAATLLALWHFNAAGFVPLHDGINGVLACLIMPVLTYLIHYFSQRREQLQAEQEKLSTAMERVQQLATRDALTGLFNRDHMNELMTHHIGRAQRACTPLSLAIIDIDLFKRVNDSFGHPVGDTILQGFAGTATEVFRQNDLIGRWGDEEFLVLFPDTPPMLAAQGLERLRQALNRRDLSLAGLGLRTTFSAGLTVWQDGETASCALQRADTALHQAKHQGRDRVITATPAHEPQETKP